MCTQKELQNSWSKKEKQENSLLELSILVLLSDTRKGEKSETDACVRAQSLSRVRLFGTPWTVAHQAPLSMGFSR